MNFFSFMSGVFDFLITYSPYFLIILAIVTLFSLVFLVFSFLGGRL